MFGYVRLNKPTITMGEYELYQGVYCTLCRRLGKRYGLLARMTLSYDMTFLAVLHMALDPDDPGFCPGHCSFNPAKRCLRCENTKATDLAADVGTLMSYYKLKDTLADEGFGKRLAAGLAYPFAAWARRRAVKRRPNTDRMIAAMMEKQAQTEAENTTSVDRAAEPFALMLQELAAGLAGDDRQRQILERFGYCLGRWIYLMDATDDLEEDLEKGRFNPYVGARDLQKGDRNAVKETREYALFALNACLAECIAAYNLLDVYRFDGILRNILEQGMPAAQKRVVSGEEST